MLQILSTVIGVLIIRQLSVVDYAHYALCVSALAAISVLSESGSSSAILTLGGPDHLDGRRLRAIVDLCLRARRKLAAAVALLVVPGLFLVLLRTHASVTMAGGLAALVLATVPGTVFMGPLHTVLRLRNDFRRLQAASIFASLLRLGVLLPLLFTVVGAASALAANTAAVYAEAWLLRRALSHHLPALGVEAPSDSTVVRRSVRRMLPIHLFYVAQGQVVITLLGILGEARTLASISAVQRFSVVFTLAATVWATVMVPAFARLPPLQATLRRWFLILTLPYATGLAFVVLLIWLASRPLLSLLGPSYQGLEGPLVVVSAGAAVAALAGLIAHLNQARGWLELSWLTIPATLVATAIAAIAFDIASPLGAAWFGFVSLAVPSVVTLVPTIAGLHRTSKA